MNVVETREVKAEVGQRQEESTSPSMIDHVTARFNFQVEFGLTYIIVQDIDILAGVLLLLFIISIKFVALQSVPAEDDLRV